MTETQQSSPSHHEASLEISNEMVGLYKQLFGRGPERRADVPSPAPT